MSYKEIPALLSSCKSIAKAYHCSVNFSRAIHEAMIRIICKSSGVIFLRFKIGWKRRDLGLFCKRCRHAGTRSFFACGAVSSRRVPSGRWLDRRNSDLWSLWLVVFCSSKSKWFISRWGWSSVNLKLSCWKSYVMYWNPFMRRHCSSLMIAAALVR